MQGIGRTMRVTRTLPDATPGVGTAAGFLHLVLPHPGKGVTLGLLLLQWWLQGLLLLWRKQVLSPPQPQLLQLLQQE